MSVILITGQPGSGKTALCVDMIAHDSQFEGRPLFVMGIPDLAVEHTPCPPVSEWTMQKVCPEDESKELSYFTFPENALVIIDEAQRIYRPRSVGSKVPPEVAAFETHRHTGIDFILLTQHAGLIDSNIRKLIGRHIHIRVTALGRYKHDWPELGDPESASSRDISAKTKYKLPKKAFDLYTSSQKHTTIKAKLPWYVYLLGLSVITFAVVGYFAYQRVIGKGQTKTTEIITETKKTEAKDGQRSNTEYLADLVPRIPTMKHTAPRYDEVTKPNDAPWPMGCMIVAKWRDKPESCRCINQQGSKYFTTDNFCRSIVENGIFKDWASPEKQQAENRNNPRQTAQRDGGDNSVSLPPNPQIPS